MNFRFLTFFTSMLIFYLNVYIWPKSHRGDPLFFFLVITFDSGVYIWALFLTCFFMCLCNFSVIQLFLSGPVTSRSTRLVWFHLFIHQEASSVLTDYWEVPGMWSSVFSGREDNRLFCLSDPVKHLDMCQVWDRCGRENPVHFSK